jgi:hypothetical protein
MPHDPFENFQPCGQSWDAMERLGDGRRFCAHCERPVTDLRGMSLEEITFAHMQNDEPLCGVYTPDQLRAPEPPKRCRTGPLVTLALGASLLAARAEAQTSATPPREHVQLPPGASPRPNDAAQPRGAPSAADDTLRIHGIVRGVKGERVGAALVWLEGSPYRTVTDSAGAFVLRVPAGGPGDVRVKFARLGYGESSRTVAITPGIDAELDVVLSEVRVPFSAGIVATATEGSLRRARKRPEGFSVARISISEP